MCVRVSKQFQSDLVISDTNPGEEPLLPPKPYAASSCRLLCDRPCSWRELAKRRTVHWWLSLQFRAHQSQVGAQHCSCTLPCFFTWLTHQLSTITISNCPCSWPSLLRSPSQFQQMVLPLMWEIHNLFAMKYTNLLVSGPFSCPLLLQWGRNFYLGLTFPLFSGSHAFPPALRVRRLNPTNIVFTKYLDLSECFTHLAILSFWSHPFLLAFMMVYTLCFFCTPSPKSSSLVFPT